MGIANHHPNFASSTPDNKAMDVPTNMNAAKHPDSIETACRLVRPWHNDCAKSQRNFVRPSLKSVMRNRESDNVRDHRAGTIDLQAEKITRKSGFACIALLSHD